MRTLVQVAVMLFFACVALAGVSPDAAREGKLRAEITEAKKAWRQMTEEQKAEVRKKEDELKQLEKARREAEREAYLQAAPKARLANSEISAIVMLPDPNKGFYKDTRFDWSGLVTHVQYKGHTFFGGGVDANGAVHTGYSMGTSDEFKVSLPIYGEDPNEPVAKLRIGVGRLEPREEKRGNRTRIRWVLVKPFPWKIEQGKEFVEFRQSVKEGPWGWEYVKRVQLADGEPAFTIARQFRNTGKQAIQCEHYCHNWTRVDGQYVGEQYHMVFAFEPKPQGDPNSKKVAKALAAVHGKRLNHGGDFWAVLGPQSSPADNDVMLVNTKAGAAMRLTGNWTPSGFNVYVKPGEACPEPFFTVDLKPGEEAKWTSKYEFLLVPKAH